MSSIRLIQTSTAPLHRRAGLVAVSEIAVVVITVASIFWLGSQLVSTMANDSAAPAQTRYSSERCVYRMSINATGEWMWAFRPRDGITQMNLKTCEVVKSLPTSGMELSAVAHSRDGRTTLMCGMDGTVALDREGQPARVDRIAASREIIADAAVSSDSSVAACLTSSGRIHVWSLLDDVECEAEYVLPVESAIVRILLNNSGRRLYVARVNGSVSIHDPVTGLIEATVECVRTSAERDTEHLGFALSEDEQLIGVATSQGRVQVYEIATGKQICNGRLTEGSASTRPTCIAISPDCRHIVVATNASSEIHAWNLKSGDFLGQFLGHEGIVRTVQFSPESDRLYSGSYDGTIREWSMATRTQVRIVD